MHNELPYVNAIQAGLKNDKYSSGIYFIIGIAVNIYCITKCLYYVYENVKKK